MHSELTFGADCVINFDDLGELKDYTDSIQEVTAALEELGSGSKQVPEGLWQILEADPEDTFHLPSFPPLLKLTVETDWTPLHLSPHQQELLIDFYLSIAQECLLSYSFIEGVLQRVVSRIKAEVARDSKRVKKVVGLLGRLSDKVTFLEESLAVGQLWSCIAEEQLAVSFSEEDREMGMAVYLECVEQFTRDPQIRLALNESGEVGLRPFLAARLCLWDSDLEKAQVFLWKVQERQWYKSDLLHQMCEWTRQRRLNTQKH